MELPGISSRVISFASCYDPVMVAVERLGLARVRNEALAGVSGRVLEIGAGTGANVTHYPAGIDLTLLEPDREMVERLETKLGARSARIIVKAFDEESYRELSGERFDYVVSTLALCTIPDTGAVLQRIAGLLAPGGRYLFIEHEVAPGMYRPLQNVVAPLWSRCFGGCHPNKALALALDDSPLVVTSLRRFRFPLGWPIVPFGFVGSARKRSDFFG